ncbi:unnamed protein product [Boreogadus saida]
MAGRGALTDKHPACAVSPGLLDMRAPWEQRDTELYMKCLSRVNARLGSQVQAHAFIASLQLRIAFQPPPNSDGLVQAARRARSAPSGTMEWGDAQKPGKSSRVQRR